MQFASHYTMPKRDAAKPKGRMSSYAFFVQCCRDEHKKKHPGENVVFAEFTRKCATKWKEMNEKEKRRFEEMAEKDKVRYQREMASYVPVDGAPRGRGQGKKRAKDPNAPKRPLSAFFIYCKDERPKVRSEFPDYPVSDVAKELGKRWEKVTDRTKYEKLAEQQKKRYELEMERYRAGVGRGGGGSPKKQKLEDSEEDDEEEEEEEEDEDDE